LPDVKPNNNEARRLEVKISPASIVIGLAVVLIVGVFGWLTFGPRPVPPPPPVLTEEARNYLDRLMLENVHMQAAESMVNSRVVEILGTIRNNGSRRVKLAEVTCVFRDYNEQVIKRERVPIVGGATGAGTLDPGQSRSFRLPFDDLAETWNQVMPTLVIAQIQFDQGAK
jgi:hypothetical protein